MYLSTIYVPIASSTNSVLVIRMTKEERVQYKFMIPVALKNRIENAAHDNRRSVSAEVVAALEERYPAPASNEEILNATVQLFRQFSEIGREQQSLAITVIEEALRKKSPELSEDKIQELVQEFLLLAHLTPGPD